jgi:hypothetical protein
MSPLKTAAVKFLSTPASEGSRYHRAPGKRQQSCRTPKLALGELEALAGALLPVLLAFLHARIAR